ncbi:MAG: 4'-phosphopantetheinyl transferase superfamily protein [Bacillota bacterium]|nr:4'-phosphopantetheinyl transferase superfamily protein [Bacillota bacterium]
MIELIAISIDVPISDKVYEDLLNLVSYEKKQRIKRFRFLEDAKRSLFADLLVRYWMCKNLKLKNSHIKFKTNDYGKPYLDGVENVFFNVSHSAQWIVCGLSNGEIGVDIEHIKDADLDIAKRFYSQEEYADLLKKPAAERNKYFFDLWTLKESYIKYKGKGLYIPLDSFSIKIEDSRVNILSENLEHPNFQRTMIDDNYMVAICSDSKELAKISYVTIEEIWNQVYQSL